MHSISLQEKSAPLADTVRGAYRGCGHKDKDCVLLEVQTAHYDLEDASDMPLAQQFNVLVGTFHKTYGLRGTRYRGTGILKRH